MRYFNQRLNTILEFVDPDRWYVDDYGSEDSEDAEQRRDDFDARNGAIDSITFIYDGNFHGLFTAPGNESHLEMIEDNLDIIPKELMNKASTATHTAYAIRNDIEDYMLIGRIGGDNQGYYVSYWNDDRELYDQFLVESLKAMLDKKIIETSYMVSTPVHDDQFVKEFIGDKTKELPPEELEKRKRQADLMRRLHLMGPDEKKRAREELGLVAKGKMPMSQRTGLLPGQRYWAMTSECVVRD